MISLGMIADISLLLLCVVMMTVAVEITDVDEVLKGFAKSTPKADTEVPQDGGTLAVIDITSDEHFKAEIEKYSEKLVVVKYTAEWCGPCEKIDPEFRKLPAKYPDVIFMNVDVDQCMGTRRSEGIQNTVPKFGFYRGGKQIDGSMIVGTHLDKVNGSVEKFSTENTSNARDTSSVLPTAAEAKL